MATKALWLSLREVFFEKKKKKKKKKKKGRKQEKKQKVGDADANAHSFGRILPRGIDGSEGLRDVIGKRLLVEQIIQRIQRVYRG